MKIPIKKKKNHVEILFNCFLNYLQLTFFRLQILGVRLLPLHFYFKFTIRFIPFCDVMMELKTKWLRSLFNFTSLLLFRTWLAIVDIMLWRTSNFTIQKKQNLRFSFTLMPFVFLDFNCDLKPYEWLGLLLWLVWFSYLFRSSYSVILCHIVFGVGWVFCLVYFLFCL